MFPKEREPFGRAKCWREDVSLRKPLSSDRKNVAPLEHLRFRGGPTNSIIAPINNRHRGQFEHVGDFPTDRREGSLCDVFHAAMTV